MSDTAISNQRQVAYAAADGNGRILFFGRVPEFMFAYQLPPAGGSIVQGEGAPETHYVKDGAIVERPANPATLAGLELANLPAPCTITVEGVEHGCEDATAELSFSHPGTYPVKVSAWPTLDATFEVIQA
jgi:hypothetical protein